MILIPASTIQPFSEIKAEFLLLSPFLFLKTFVHSSSLKLLGKLAVRPFPSLDTDCSPDLSLFYFALYLLGSGDFKSLGTALLQASPSLFQLTGFNGIPSLLLLQQEFFCSILIPEKHTSNESSCTFGSLHFLLRCNLCSWRSQFLFILLTTSCSAQQQGRRRWKPWWASRELHPYTSILPPQYFLTLLAVTKSHIEGVFSLQFHQQTMRGSEQRT